VLSVLAAPFFSSYAGKVAFFSSYIGFGLTFFGRQVAVLPVRWASLVSSYVGSHKDGTPLASLEVDVNRLVLLDRAENGDGESSEDVPF
jgi:hypothetical protein